MERKFAEFGSLVEGLDTFINPTEIVDGATPDCDNVIPTGKGAFKTRLGRIAHGGEITENYGGQGYFTYIASDGSYEELVVVNGVLKKKNGDSWDTISGGTLSTSARICAACEHCEHYDDDQTFHINPRVSPPAFFWCFTPYQA